MPAVLSLIPELESVVRRGSDRRRSDVLLQIAGIFVTDAHRLSGEQVRLFDDIFLLLIDAIDSSARSDLSSRIAPLANAPLGTLRRLAKDQDIAVAGPVLVQSLGLETSELVEIANTMSSCHLLALAGRPSIEEPVTDILAARGDDAVKRRLASNARAKLSERGFSLLVGSAEHDGALAEAITARDDIPANLFRDLLTRATGEVQLRLLATARPKTSGDVRRVISSVSDRDGLRRQARDFTAAQETIRGLAEAGRLGEQDVAAFAREGSEESYDNMVSALAQLTGVPVSVVERLICGERADAILILCKAVGYSWKTARDVLVARQGERGSDLPALDAASDNFDRLSLATARRVLRFWQITPGSLKAAV